VTGLRDEMVGNVRLKLDEEVERFARRRLEEPYPYLILDARYEKVREDGAVRSQAGATRPLPRHDSRTR
jgi:transposase-like protein